jgi:hypothetical protein
MTERVAIRTQSEKSLIVSPCLSSTQIKEAETRNNQTAGLLDKCHCISKVQFAEAFETKLAAGCALLRILPLIAEITTHMARYCIFANAYIRHFVFLPELAKRLRG